MTTIPRWIFGAHLYLGTCLLISYVCWIEINAADGCLKGFWRKLRLVAVSILMLFLLYFSLNLMGTTYLIPRFNGEI